MNYLFIDLDGSARQKPEITDADKTNVVQGDLMIFKQVGSQFWWLEVDFGQGKPPELNAEWRLV